VRNLTRGSRKVTRRHVVGGIAAGSALVTMPAFLAGCGVQPAIEPTVVPPADPFLAWFGVDEARLSRLFALLTANGADAADVYFQHRRENILEMQAGVVTRADSRILQGVGMRVMSGVRTGYAHTGELTLPAMENAARAAAGAVSGGSPVSPQGLAASPPGSLYVVEVPWSEVASERKVGLLERLDRRARAADPAVDSVVISWSDVDERVTIATLDGRLVGDERPMTRLAVRVAASRSGRQESGFANLAARAGLAWYTDERMDTLAREAVDRALLRFDAVRAPSGEMPVVLAAGSSGILLHEAVGHAFEADFNEDGTSHYSGRVGEQIADRQITLVDQGTLPRERGALNYDDEGTACRRTVLVQGGVLESWLHDSLSAARAGVPPTGSGRRESYRFAPMPRMSCTFIENGPHTREEIIATVDRGVIAETYTAGQVQAGAGGFTFAVDTGWLVEDGRATAPVRDFRLTGIGADVLSGITMVANDGRMDGGGWTCGKKGQQVPVSQGMPTVLVSSLKVDGA
jgi:TldD protein